METVKTKTNEAYMGAIKKLRQMGFRPSKNVNVKLDSREVVGLTIDQAPIGMFEKVVEIKEILGDNFKVVGNTNRQEINIELNAHNG